MSFKDYEYKRPNIEELKEKFTVALEKFDNAKTAEEQKQVIHSINEIRKRFWYNGESLLHSSFCRYDRCFL